MKPIHLVISAPSMTWTRCLRGSEASWSGAAEAGTLGEVAVRGQVLQETAPTVGVGDALGLLHQDVVPRLHHGRRAAAARASPRSSSTPAALR